MTVAEPEVDSTSELADGRAPGTAVLVPHVPRLAARWSATGAGRIRVLDGTLVFADISGFTALSERLAAQGPIGAEELTDVLGRCFAELLAVAYAGGGSLVKFGGDALLLLFDGADHARRGVDAAIDMRTTMARVGQLSTSVGRVRLRMSLGVHSGDLHAVRVGASHHELLLVGPGASTVVTMEGTADAGEIVVSAATASRVDPALLGDDKGTGVLLRRHARARARPDAPPHWPVSGADDDVVASVPVALREHLSAGGGESEHRPATIAFLHFDGTDELVATHGEEALADALEVLVADVQRACSTHGVTFLGSDLDHDGGKLILVAGVPRVLGDDDGRMLRAVHEIVSSPRAIPVRIGVNRGRVFAGEVGPPYRRTFTVMGDAVNLAARLMAKAEPGQVLVSGDVLERSRSAFETAPLPPFFVKGKRKAVEAFGLGRLLGTQEVRRSSQLPLTGRGAELAMLLDAWRTARSGAGRVVELSGAVGIGKTRMVEELRSAAAGDEVRFVTCEQYEQATPYFSFRVLLRALLELPEPTEASLRAAVLAADPELEPWLPLVADVLDIACADTDVTRSLEPKFRRLRTNLVVDSLLRRLLDHPAVLVFDDVQWMDTLSSDLLTRLCANVAGRSWLVCVTQREDGSFEVPEAEHVERLVLEPLAEGEARQLVRAATRGRPLPPHVLTALISRSGGNPLFLEELVRVASVDDGQLPESLEAVACAQIDLLATRAGRLLRTAAVLGTSFEPALLDAVAGDDVIALGALAEHLHLEPDGRLRFRHRLIRDAAYALLPYRRRQEIHGRAAEAIERIVEGADAVDRTEALALHFHHAERHEATWRWATLAGERAAAKGSPSDAVAHYEKALAAARKLPELTAHEVADAWVQLSMVAAVGGFYDRAKAGLRSARQLLADDPVALAGLCFREARLADHHARSQDVIRWIRRGLRVIEAGDDTDTRNRRTSLQSLYAYTRQRSGRPKEAIAWARRVVEADVGASNPQALAQAYLVLDWAHIDLGRPDLATNATAALELLHGLGEYEELAIALNNLGAFAYYQGRWHDALDLYRRATEMFERVGDVVDAALSVSNRAEIFTYQGRLDEAEELLDQIIDVWSSMSFPYGLAVANRHLARVRLRQGDVEGALTLFRSARTTFEAYGLAGKLVELDAWIAECLLRSGAIREAAALVDDARMRERSGGSSEMTAMLDRLAGYAALAERRIVDAWAAFDSSLDVARRRSSAYDVALALEGMAAVAELGGAPEARPVEVEVEERRDLLAGLGVVVQPPPPVALSA